MAKVKIIWRILIVIIGFALSSCTETIDFDFEQSEEQVLVVDGRITNERKAHEVKLSLSSKFYAPAEESDLKAEGAEVTIWDGTNTYQLSESEPGIYKTDTSVQGEVGKTYVLTISYDGQVYESTVTMKGVPSVDSLETRITKVPVGPFVGYYEILLYTTETEGLGDFYMWNSYVNGVNQSDTLGRFQFQDDALFDGQEWEGVLIDFVDAEPGDTITLKQFSISESAFEFYVAANMETTWRGTIFDTPSSSVPSNISNGALGLFDASAVSSRSVVAK